MNRHLIVAVCCLWSLTMTSFSSAAEPPAKTRVTLQTNQGDIEVELFCDVAPLACKNFIGLAKKGYYNGGVFHRVIKGFMIQGGDPTATGAGGESLFGRPFEDEVSKSVTFDKPGLLAMANAGPGTNGSQFFITTAATPWLNMHHTIFGRVVRGYDIVEKIAAVPVDASDRPIKEQKIQKILVEGQE